MASSSSSMHFQYTTDVYDHLVDKEKVPPHEIRVLDEQFHSYGRAHTFQGTAVTVRCLEDNSIIKKLVGTDGKGKVMVVDGAGSLRFALLGGSLAAKAAANGWEGLVIRGAVRDVREIDDVRIGVKCLGVIPRKTEKKGAGEEGVVLRMGGVTVRPGDYVYCDMDGVIILDKCL
eukprot:Nk52_evm1s560 gene=Nk52_evmTU1s560